MSEKLHVAVIGCGLIAKEKHIPALKRMKDKVDLCAVCDINEGLVNETAMQFHISKAYSNVSKMLQNEELDFIDICVPPQVHTPVALEAIENNCSVTMEKPMALKVSDCDLIIAAAKKHNVKLCIGHNNLFHPPFIEAKKLVNENLIGDVIGMRIFISTPRWDMIDLKDHWYHKLPGGVIGETGPHMAYTTMAFLKNISNIDVFAKNFLHHPWAPFDEFRIELEGDNGICSAILSYATNCWHADFEIIGVEGSLKLDLMHMTLLHHHLKKQEYIPIGKSSLSEASQIIGNSASNTLRVITGKYKLGIDYVLEKVVDCIVKDTSPPVSGEEGREAVRIMEMVVEKYQEKYFPRKDQ